jgi:hypothetical protein
MKVNERVKILKDIADKVMQKGFVFSLLERNKTDTGQKSFHIVIKNEFGSTVFCTCDRCCRHLPKLTKEENLELASWLMKTHNNLHRY